MDEVNPYSASPVASTAAAEPPVPRGQPMTVAFSLEVDDVVAFIWHFQQTAPRPRQQRRKFTVAAGALLVVACAAALAIPDSLPLVAMIFFAAAVLLAVRSRRLRWKATLQSVVTSYAEPADRKLLGWRQVSIDAQGITQSTDLIRGAYRWPAIAQIAETAEHVLFYIGTSQALIVPHRAFGDQAHYAAFVATARAFQQQAVGQPSL